MYSQPIRCSTLQYMLAVLSRPTLLHLHLHAAVAAHTITADLYAMRCSKMFTFVQCILILSKFYLFTIRCTSELSYKNNIKIYIKIALTCFGVTVTPTSGSAHHTTTLLTTHRCILMGYSDNCNFSKHKLMRSLMMV